MAKPFIILSIDGGGLRGIVPCLILEQIAQIAGKPIQEIFHLAAGTSTGGLIACGLAIGKTPTDLKNIYVNDGKTIFPQTSGLSGLLNGAESLFNPKFSPDGLQSVLNTNFADTTMNDCKMPVIACSYDLATNTPLLFKSRYVTETPAINAKLADVCRATSAAPTYLPAFQMTYNNIQRVCIDGGVYINNPGMAAFTEISKYYSNPYYGCDPDFDPDRDTFMLSLGTGSYTANLAQSKWMQGGVADWAQPISDIMMQATNQSTTYECNEMLPHGQYYRISIAIDNEKFSNMTDSSDFTREYLINQVQQQVFNSAPVMSGLKTFLRKAGVINAS